MAALRPLERRVEDAELAVAPDQRCRAARDDAAHVHLRA